MKRLSISIMAVVVAGLGYLSAQQPKSIDQRVTYQEPNHRIVVNSASEIATSRTIFDLLGKMPGVGVVGRLGEQRALIRNRNANYFLDGVPVDVSLVRDLAVQRVEFIDVLKGPRAMIYGANPSVVGNRFGTAAGGAIFIYTRSESPVTILSYLQPEDLKTDLYYMASYDALRTTPALLLDRSTVSEDGNAEAASIAQNDSYLVSMQGINKDCEPFLQESLINP